MPDTISTVMADCLFCSPDVLEVWLNGNAFFSNIVALLQTQLLLLWMTLCGWVNHLGCN